MVEKLKNNPSETAACCCVDVGTIMDNSDCTASYQKLFASRKEAESMLQFLTDKARSIESEPCQIKETVSEDNQGFLLQADFTFACEAETLIFQLGLR